MEDHDDDDDDASTLKYKTLPFIVIALAAYDIMEPSIS